nr:SDR family oxidoreductase [uncultured Hyphomonas sp.]
MSFRKPDGVAVITGASSGIGAAFAERLASEGYPLLLVARRKDRLDQAAADLSARHGVKVETLAADLVDPADLAGLEARLRAGGVAMLVNNAGAGGLGPTAASTPDKMQDLIWLNVIALTRLSHAALEGVRKAGAGVLINLGSVIAFAPSAGGAVYSGTKAYVLNFTRALQMEYASSDIRIQVLMPGPVRTEFFSSQGLSDAVFPEESFLSAEQLVSAALAGLSLGETVTTPTLANPETWDEMEIARGRYMAEVISGAVAPRYLGL